MGAPIASGRSAARGLDEIAAEAPKTGEGPLLVAASKPAVSDDVSNPDRCGLPGLAYCALWQAKDCTKCSGRPAVAPGDRKGSILINFRLSSCENQEVNSILLAGPKTKAR
jgi:hypothetical protein